MPDPADSTTPDPAAPPLSLTHARDAFEELSEAQLRHFGPVLVVAPHPDDESLGVGGLIARLRSLVVPVQVLLTTDGSASHPNSQTHPPATLARLREAEIRLAIGLLGCDPDFDFYPLGLPDGALPQHAGQPGFAYAVRAATAVLRATVPATLIVPWRRDPHPDHRATWHILRAAAAAAHWRGRWFEYLVWAWERATPEDLPRANELRGWRVAVADFLPRKQAAIRAHVSQTTNLIEDDPTGFVLADSMLTHFAHPWEVLLEDVREVG